MPKAAPRPRRTRRGPADDAGCRRYTLTVLPSVTDEQHHAGGGGHRHQVVVRTVRGADLRHAPLPVLVAVGAVVRVHVGIRRHVEIVGVGGQRGDAVRDVLGHGGRAVAVDHPRHRGPPAGGILGRGEHGPVGALRRRDPVGRERQGDRRARLQWARGRDGGQGRSAGGLRGRGARSGPGRRARGGARVVRRGGPGGRRAGTARRQQAARAPLPARPVAGAGRDPRAPGQYGGRPRQIRCGPWQPPETSPTTPTAAPWSAPSPCPTVAVPDRASSSATRDRGSTTTPAHGPPGWPTSSATWPSRSTTTARVARSKIARR